MREIFPDKRVKRFCEWFNETHLVPNDTPITKEEMVITLNNIDDDYLKGAWDVWLHWENRMEKQCIM